jgi:invasion protein IalB
MKNALTILTATVLLGLSFPAVSQETTPTAETATPAPETTANGETSKDADEAFPVEPSTEIEDGVEYVKEVHGDWQINCLRQNGLDNCSLYQLLKDPNDNPTAEITILTLPEGSKAQAGVTIVTPLGTLLTAQAALRVDSGKVRRYPYSWCDRGGCYARFGLTSGDISGFKKGSGATVSLVAIAAADQPLELPMSLTGFTAGWAALQELK